MNERRMEMEHYLTSMGSTLFIPYLHRFDEANNRTGNDPALYIPVASVRSRLRTTVQRIRKHFN